MSLNTTPVIVAGSMPSRAIGNESVGIFTFNYTGTGTLSIQTSLDGISWHPGSAISIQGATPTYNNWIVGSANQPYSVIRITPTVSGTTNFYVRIFSVTNDTYSNTWFTSLTSFVALEGGFGTYIQGKNVDGTGRIAVNVGFDVSGAAIDGAHTRLIQTGQGSSNDLQNREAIETNAVTIVGTLGNFFHIIRYSASGQILWKRRASIGNAGSATMPKLVQDESGNVYLAVYSMTLFMQDTSTAEQTFAGAASTRHIVKLSSTGQFVWSKTLLGAIETFGGFHIAVGGQNLAVFTDQPASPMVWDGVATTARTNLWKSKVLIVASTDNGGMLWNKVYNPTAAKLANSDKLDVNNYGYVAVHLRADTAAGDWSGEAVPTMVNNSSKVSVFSQTGVLIYTTGILSGSANTANFNSGLMFLKRSSENVFVTPSYTSNTSFRVPSNNVYDTVTQTGQMRVELGPLGLVSTKSLVNSAGFTHNEGTAGPDLGLGIATPYLNHIRNRVHFPDTGNGEVVVRTTRLTTNPFTEGNKNNQNFEEGIIQAQFDQHGNAYTLSAGLVVVNSQLKLKTDSVTNYHLYTDLVAPLETTTQQPSNFMGSCNRDAWITTVGYQVDGNPVGNNGNEPPTPPVSSNWPASLNEGETASGVFTGFDPEGLASTTTGQGTTAPVLQVWDPLAADWVDNPETLQFQAVGTFSFANSGFLNVGVSTVFVPEEKWYGDLVLLCRWKLGIRVSATTAFTTTYANIGEATDAPSGEMPDVFEGEIVEGTFVFTTDPDNQASYTWQLSPQHTEPNNWDTLYPPNQYPNGQPEWHTTIASTIQVLNNAGETMGTATVLSTNHGAKSAVLRFTSLPGKTGTGKFDVRVNNGIGSPWTTVLFKVDARPSPTFFLGSFPSVSESSYSQAEFSFSHVYEGVDIPAEQDVSYSWEFTSDSDAPDDWDTLYPPANYPNGQPEWPVTWTASAQAVDNEYVSVGLVNVQSQNDANRTAVLRFTPIDGFTGSASVDLRVKATWPVTATRPVAVSVFSGIKSKNMSITALETPGNPTGSMPNCNEDSTSTGTWTFTYQALATEGYDITWQLSPQTDQPENWDALYPPESYPYGQPDFHTVTGQSVNLVDETNTSVGTAAILVETDALKRTTIRFTPTAHFTGSVQFDLRAVVTWPVSEARPITVAKFSSWVTANVSVIAQPDSPVLQQPTAPITSEDTQSEFTITWTDPDKTAAQISEEGGGGYKVILNTTGSGVGTDQEVITTTKAIVRVISYSPNSLQATLRIEPLANQNGTFSVFMRIQDDEVSSRFSGYRKLTVNILAVPDAPTPVQGAMPFALFGQTVSGTFTTTDVDSTHSHFLISSSFGGSYVKTLVAGNLTLTVVDALTTDRQATVQLTQTTPHNLTSYGFFIRAYDVNSENHTTAGGLFSTPVFVSGLIGTASQGSDTGGGGQVVNPGPGGSGAQGLWGAADGGTYIFPTVAGTTTVTRISPFTTVIALSVTESLDGSGFCEMTVAAREVALRASQANKTVDSYLKAGSVELTINIGGSTFFVGVISETAWETDSGTVRISARGLLSYFDNRIIPRVTNFVARNLSDLIADLIMGSQSFAYGDLAITNGVSQVSANGTFTFQGGTTISDAIGQVLDKVDAPEIWIGPDRILRAEATRGIDNQARVRITSGVATVASWTRRNDGVVTVAKVIGGPDGAEGFFSGSAGSVSGAQVFGLVEKQYDVPALLSNGECIALAQRIVDSYNEEVQAIAVSMTLTPDRKFYIADLEIGNVITVDLVDPTLGQIYGAYRVINRTVTLVDTAVGTYDVSLDLEPAKFVANKLIGSRSRHNPKLLTDSAKAEMLLRQA